MTVRIMVVARKNPELSNDEFRDYYRDRHLPFMQDLLGRAVAVHRRHYVMHGDRGPTADIDVISEALYEDEATLERVIAALADPEKRRLRMEDESRFLDPASIRIVRVETEETVFRALPEGRA